MTEQQALEFAKKTGLKAQSIRGGRQVVIWHQDPTEEQFDALEAAGWNVNRITFCCNIWTEKEIPETPKARYERASEEDQIEMDLAFLNTGAYLSPEKMQRLRDAGKTSIYMH